MAFGSIYIGFFQQYTSQTTFQSKVICKDHMASAGMPSRSSTEGRSWWWGTHTEGGDGEPEAGAQSMRPTCQTHSRLVTWYPTPPHSQLAEISHGDTPQTNTDPTGHFRQVVMRGQLSSALELLRAGLQVDRLNIYTGTLRKIFPTKTYKPAELGLREATLLSIRAGYMSSLTFYQFS